MTKRIIFDGQDNKTFVAFLVFDPYFTLVDEQAIKDSELAILRSPLNIPAANIVSHIPGLPPSVFGFIN